MVKNLLRDNELYYYTFWIGLSDRQKEGTNVWEETGTFPTYEDYYTDYVESEGFDCKSLSDYYYESHYHFHWKNNDCNVYDYSLCEYPSQ